MSIKGHEKETILHDGPEFRIVYIESFEAQTAEMNQNIDELVTIIQGWAMLKVEDEDIRLEKNDSYFIHKNTRHQVLMTSLDCCWLCVFYKQD